MKSSELVILTVLLHLYQITLQKSTPGPQHQKINGKKLNGSLKGSASFSPRNVTDLKLPPIFSIKNPASKTTGKIPVKIFTTAFPKVNVTKATIQNSLYRFGPASHNMHAPSTKFKEIKTLSPNGTFPDIANSFLNRQSKEVNKHVTKQSASHRNSLSIPTAPNSVKWSHQFRGQNMWPSPNQNIWQQTKPVQVFQNTWQNSRRHNQLIVPKNQGVLSSPLAWYNPWKINPILQQKFHQNLPSTNPSLHISLNQKDQSINWPFHQPPTKNFQTNNMQFQRGFIPKHQPQMAFGNAWQNNWRKTSQPMMAIDTGWKQFSPPLAYLHQQPTHQFPGTWRQIPSPKFNQFQWEHTFVGKTLQSQHPWEIIPVSYTPQFNFNPWANVKGGKLASKKATVSPKLESENSLLISTVNNMTASVTKFVATMEKIITTLNGLTIQ